MRPVRADPFPVGVVSRERAKVCILGLPGPAKKHDPEGPHGYGWQIASGLLLGR